jgi:hypothetical protein
VSRRLIAVVAGLAVLALAMVGLARLTGGDDGSAHPLGTEIAVGYSDPTDAAAGTRTRLGLTILAVRRGKPADLEANGIEVDPEDRTSTPYYVDARWVNKGSEAVDQDLSVGLEDTEGATLSHLLVIGGSDEPFGPCPSPPSGKLAPGETIETCSLVLVPEGLEVERVYFLSDNGPDAEPEWVYWRVD